MTKKKKKEAIKHRKDLEYCNKRRTKSLVFKFYPLITNNFLMKTR